MDARKSHKPLRKMLILVLATTSLAACGNGFRPAADDSAYSIVRSLTGASYSGKKFYLGWGSAGDTSPAMMQNEVRYDVLHTHDIFTNKIGGDYRGTEEIGAQATPATLRRDWQTIGSQIGANDMYVQYSSGHGYPGGLGVGLDYGQIRDRVMSFNAKETIVFTMACFSGSEVDAFRARDAEFRRLAAQGKTLFVLTSSGDAEESSTGPGYDPDEPNGPLGSAGSAFGHSLWKALAGDADGVVDGVKDGMIDLSEVQVYTTQLTQQIGGHTPVAYGYNYEHLIMNEVPSSSYLADVKGGTEGLSDAQVREAAAALDSSQLAQAANGE